MRSLQQVNPRVQDYNDYSFLTIFITDSDEVTQWLKELEGFTIPDLNPTVDGSCANDAAAANNAAARGWWTCGGHTRSTGKFCSQYFFSCLVS
jgi:hypothetical protein